MVVTCDIQFEQNPEAIYYAGQVVMGKITLTADKTKQVKAVNLKINGSAKTRWHERPLENKDSNIYCGEVEYLKRVICLLEPNASDQAVVIEPGIHTFSFVCHLPTNCPSSFEGEFGSIRYSLQVLLERPWKFDQSFTKAFTVLAIKDLNFDGSLLQQPVNTDITKSFCCGPFKSHPLQISVQLPQTGFVPGESIPVHILITNETKAVVNEIVVRLVMVVTFFTTNPEERSKSDIKTLYKLTGDKVQKNCKKHFNYLLPVPATPPSCSSLCGIIKISYRVDVDAKLQGIIYRSQYVHTPVIIGNVPLQKNDVVIQEQPTLRFLNFENDTRTASEKKVENDNQLTTASIENREPWSAVGNLPAPVYMESVHMPPAELTDNNPHDYGEKTFTPKYPVFNITNSTGMQQMNGDEVDTSVVVPYMMEDPDRSTWL